MSQTEARPTQEIVAIDYVKNGVLALKNGSFRKILIVSGVNFDLKSEDEQSIIVAGFQNLLNSLHFSAQFFIHSRRLNIDGYLEKLGERHSQETNELLQNQITEYTQFVRAFVGQNPIMTKTFFVVVPFDPILIPGASAVAGKKFFGLFDRSTPQPSIEKAPDHVVAEHIEQLEQRVAQVVAELTQIGLRAAPLADDEVLDLFYNLYNPESRERKATAPIEET